MAALSDFLKYLDNKLTQVDNLEKDKKVLQTNIGNLTKKLEEYHKLSEDLAILSRAVSEQKTTLDNIQTLITESQKNYDEFASFVRDRLEKESSLQLER